jgi:hypothetical protein
VKLLLLVLLVAFPLASQVTTVTLYGVVADQSSAAVAGAAIVAENEQTNAAYRSASNDQGEFTFQFLPIGVYRLRVDAKGFRPVVQNGLSFTAGQAVRLRYSLELSEVKEAVTVSAETTQINAVNSEQRATLSGDSARELPVQRRDWTNTLRLGTGIAVGGRSSNSVAMNGLAPSGFRFTVDGTNATSDQEYPAMGMDGGFNIVKAISMEAIAEVNTVKGIASAENAGSMSGNVNLVTRSGSNEFHGSGFWNNQLENYNARNPFLASNPGATFNQYGGSLGGRIIRNRLFFFGAYEGYQQRAFQSVSGTVPTPEFRARALAAQPLYKPALDLLPLPTQPYAPTAINAQYNGASSQRAADNHLTARSDYYLNERNLFTFRYTRGRPDQISPRFIELNPRSFLGASEQGTFSYTRSSANFVAVTRFGYNYNRSLRVDNRYNLGIGNISGAIGFNVSSGETFFKEGNTSSVEQNFAWNRGAHSTKFGGTFQRQAGGRDNIDLPNFNYATVDDFLANIPSTVTLTFGVKQYVLRTLQIGGFFQDDWKLRRNLILSYGFRYDLFTVPTERDNRVFNRDAPYGFGPLRAPDEMFNSDRNNFAPRLSLAWTLDAAGKTVLRTGAGYFFSPRSLFGGPLETVLTALDEPFRTTLSRAEAQRLNVRYPATLAETLPKVRGNTGLWANTSIDPNFPNPFSVQWLFSLSRQLSSASSLEVAYVGNRASQLNMVRVQNLPDRVTGVRPVAGFGEFRYYDPSDNSSYNSLQTSYRRRFQKDFSLNVNYTWARNLSFSDGDLLLAERPQDNNNIRIERGPTPYERRHALAIDGLYELPLLRLTNSPNRATKLALGGWQFSAIFEARGGSPINVSQNSAWPSARPDYNGAEPTFSNWRETLQFLNPAAFVLIPTVRASGVAERFGNLGRNALRGPAVASVDFSLGKRFALTERLGAQFRAEMFNATNTPIFGGLQSGRNANTFGRFTNANVRTMQLHLRINF